MILPTIINDGDIIVRDSMEIRAVGTERFGDLFYVWMLCAGVLLRVAVCNSRDEAKARVAEICKQAGIEIDNPQGAAR